MDRCRQMRERERERETETERDRDRDRERQRETERDRDKNQRVIPKTTSKYEIWTRCNNPIGHTFYSNININIITSHFN